MSQTRQSLVDAAIYLAGEKGINRDAEAEILLPRAFYYVANRLAAEPLSRNLVVRTSTLALVNGTIGLPATVLVRYMYLAAVADPADAAMARKMRHVASWSEFIRPLTSVPGYFTVQNSQFYMTRPGAAYTLGSGMTGNVSLTVPQAPAIPAAAGDTVIAADEVTEEIILALAAALKGEAWAREVTRGN